MEQLNNAKKVALSLSILAILVIISSFSKLINFFADYAWFKEVGYTSTFLKQIFAKLYVGVPFFIVLFVFIAIYLFGIKRSYYSHMNVGSTKEEEKVIKSIIMGVSFVLALFFSFGISSSFWLEILKFVNATSFDIKDPIFAKDISFYVFKLPLINEVFSSLTGFLLFLFIITVAFYFIMLSIKPPTRRMSFNENITDINSFRENMNSIPKRIMNLALNQILVIGIVFFIILGLSSYLSAFNLLYSPRGVAYGASYTDITISLNVYRIQVVLSIVSAVLLVLAYMKKKGKIALIGPILMIIVMVLSSLVEAGVQNFIVAPNEIVKEGQYLDYNIKNTRMAYNLDEVDVRSFDPQNNLSAQDILENDGTISNVSVNDYRPTKEIYNQLQGIRSYYKFNDVDVDRYMVDGKLRQMFISPRELNKDALPSKTWLNEHIKYTHGYGLAMSFVNEITTSGQPKMAIKNIPPKTDFEEFEVQRPEIYFGEQRDKFIVVNTTESEFDYPKGDTNAFTAYEGNAGIKMTFFNKLIYSIKEQSLKLLVSGGISSDSKMIINRNIMDRVKKIAPFLSFDKDPYMVLVDKKLYWIVDGYSYTSRYPYSQPFDNISRINYIRNSFKVIIDAYNGDTTFYVVDEKDPIINTYSKVFKDLFKPYSNMPEEFKKHLRYPKQLFSIQAKLYQDYHMMNTEVFYNKEDRWEIAKEEYEGKSRTQEPSYVTFKLPKEEKPEFLLSTSYTPNKKPNMVSLFLGRNDGENYGKLIAYKFPKEKAVLGSEQIENKISNTPEISREYTLLNSNGSSIIKGHLLTIPIENSLLYIEPLYVRADTTESIPEVKRIVVAYNDKIVMEPTLEEALDKIFGDYQEVNTNTNNNNNNNSGNNTNIVIDPSLDKDELIIKAANLYNQIEQSAKDGNWTDYGKYMDELGAVLKQINSKVEN